MQKHPTTRNWYYNHRLERVHTNGADPLDHAIADHRRTHPPLTEAQTSAALDILTGVAR